MPTAESPYGFGDLRPYHVSGALFIGQAWHLTKKRQFNDTLNFLIYSVNTDSEEPAKTRLRALSISQIGGAYCDAGQNFSNLATLFKALGVPYTEVGHLGCEPPQENGFESPLR